MTATVTMTPAAKSELESVPIVIRARINGILEASGEQENLCHTQR
jgi:hypothetical protein